MIILKTIQELANLNGPIVLAAGTFDGLHLGHQALIRSAIEKASSLRGTAVVMTFDRHPASVVRPDRAPRLLTTNAAKVELLDRMGVPALLLLEFTPGLASITAEDFIGMLRAASKPLSAVCVGSQWSFGKGGVGNIALLATLGERHGFSVERIAPVEAQGTPINSTRIRMTIAAGDFEQAAACLGRNYLLTGTVVSGGGLGSKMGFPTANLEVSGMQLPPNGVYAVKVFRGSDLLKGVCNIGLRPTVDASATTPVVEVHLFDCSGDLVGEELSLEFVKFLRGEQKFSGLEELKAQIARDCTAARGLL
jgi:riboflavin kinase/FMN adenylyltransferase